MEIAIIADDLTGANDSGVQLAKAGLDTVVWLDGAETAQLVLKLLSWTPIHAPSSQVRQKRLSTKQWLNLVN